MKCNAQNFYLWKIRLNLHIWKGYLPNLLETALLTQIFVFWVREAGRNIKFKIEENQVHHNYPYIPD